MTKHAPGELVQLEVASSFCARLPQSRRSLSLSLSLSVTRPSPMIQLSLSSFSSLFVPVVVFNGIVPSSFGSTRPSMLLNRLLSSALPFTPLRCPRASFNERLASRVRNCIAQQLRNDRPVDSLLRSNKPAQNMYSSYLFFTSVDQVFTN